MVNVYLNPADAERYNNPYYSGQAATADEAAYRAGQSVGFRGSYSPYEQYGSSPQHLAIVQAEQNQQTQAQQQASRGNPYLNRPDMVRQQDLGDRRTQQLMQEGYTAEQALELQRQEAAKTPGLTDDRYYENEFAKALQTNISTADAYHHWSADTGVPQQVNPYEYVSDLSLMTLKGTAGRNAGTTPTDAALLGLTQGRGVQDNAWLNARSPGSVSPDYTMAANTIAQAKRSGDMGQYGTLQSYSSGLGVLTVPEQQAIGQRAAPGAGWQTRPELQQYNPAAYMGMYGYGGQGRILQSRQAPANIQQQQVQQQQQGLPKPFISTVTGGMTPSSERIVVKPTGALPFIGEVPIISPMLAFFEPETITTKTRGAPVSVPISDYDRNSDGSYGAARTRSFVVDGKPSSEWTRPVGEPIISAPYPVGEPIVRSTYDPITGETIITTDQPMQSDIAQNYETISLPKTGMAIPITTTVETGKSGFENLNQGVRDTLNLPSPEQGETAMRFASLANPFTVAPTVTSLFNERFNPAAAEGSRAVEGLVGLRGQYTQFYEQPLLMPVSYAIGAGIGTGWGAIKGVSQVARAATAERVISSGGAWRYAERGSSAFMQYAPVGMTALYGASVADRSTSGFTNFNPESVVTRSKGLLIQEAVPGMIGFSTPGYVASKGIRAAELTRIDYLSMRQEAKAQNLANIPTMGRPGLGEIKYTPRDYLTFKAQKSIAETRARGEIFGENMMNAYAEARVLGVPKMQVAIENSIYGGMGKYYQMRGYGKYAPKEVTPPKITAPSPKVQDIPKTSENPFRSRISKKIVGGKSVSGLSPEPSLKSKGVKEISSGAGTSTKPFFEGRSKDFRNTNRGSMKPMTDIKQSAILLPQEQIPMQKQAMSPRQIPQQQGRGQNLVTPIQASGQMRSVEIHQMADDVLPGISSRSALLSGSNLSSMVSQKAQQRMRQDLVMQQAQEQRFDQTTRKKQSPGIISMVNRGVSQMQRPTPRNDQIITVTPISKITNKTDQGITQKTSSITGQRNDQRTDQRTDQKTDQWTITDPVITTIQKPTITTPPVIPFGLPGGGSGGFGGFGGNAYYKYRERTPTWKPEQQARALLTGSYAAKKKPSKSAKGVSFIQSGVGKAKQSRRRKR